MTRLIDANALREDWLQNGENEYVYDTNAFLESIDKQPTVDAEPVRHGHNENKEYHEVDEFICSECGLHLEDWTRYVYDEYSDEKYAQEYIFKRCPECGAKIGVQ